VVRFDGVRDIIVVGSLNVDVSVRAERLPKAGETVRGSGLEIGPGGKGSNQAIAAARLGGRVHMVGRVGRDSFAAIPRRALEEAGIDTTCVHESAGAHTGTALIVVDEPTGQNAIAVAGGANRDLSPEDVRDAVAAFRASAILLVQLEAPPETVEAALDLARETQVRSVFDPAPARALPDTLLQKSHILTPNETEAEALTGIEVRDVESAAAAGTVLRDRMLGDVIVTLGELGCVWVFASGFEHVPAPRVRAIDTTGAGDAFNGGLGAALARGESMGRAIRFAVRAGAAATLQPGAANAMPTLEELEAIGEA
jgi:ribokinase